MFGLSVSEADNLSSKGMLSLGSPVTDSYPGVSLERHSTGLVTQIHQLTSDPVLL